MRQRGTCPLCQKSVHRVGVHCLQCKPIAFPSTRIPIIERLNAHTKAVAGPLGNCWQWTGNINRYGYGRITMADGLKSQDRVHRVAYKHFHPEWDGQGVVMHACDNRACWNPQHLSVGTQEQNLEDMHAKKRHAKGSDHVQAKLTEADIPEIRSSPLSSVKLAIKYGVSASNIDQIRWCKTWRHLAEV